MRTRERSQGALVCAPRSRDSGRDDEAEVRITAQSATEELQRAPECVENFKSRACMGCGGFKSQRDSFCGSCYYILPENIKRGLRGMRGYVLTFTRAMECLRKCEYYRVKSWFQAIEEGRAA